MSILSAKHTLSAELDKKQFFNKKLSSIIIFET